MAYDADSYFTSSGHAIDYTRLPPDRNLMEGLSSTVIRTLTRPVVAMKSSDESIKPKHLKYVASYNWVDESQPTIIIPGMYFLPGYFACLT